MEKFCSRNIKLSIFLDKYLISISLFLYTFCLISNISNAIKNISLGLCILFLIVCFIINKNYYISNIIKNLKNNKLILFLCIFFLVYAFIVSCFPYLDNYNSSLKFLKELKRPILFIIIVIFWFDDDENKKNILYVSLLFTFLSVMINYCGLFLNSKLSVDINFAKYFDILFPFLLISFFIFKHKILKIFFVFIMLFNLFMLILTGARGSWLVCIVSVAILISILFLKDRRYIKYIINNKFKFLFIISLFCMMSFFAFLNSQIAQTKISQGFNSSGRDIILNARLPIFINSNRVIFGLGYGNFQYEEFLLNNRTQEHIKHPYSLGPYILEKDGRIKYLHDEPTFLAQFYHYGIGVLIFMSLVLVMLYKSFVSFIKKDDFLSLALFLSIFETYIIRGLFEDMGIALAFLYVGFYIVFYRRCE